MAPYLKASNLLQYELANNKKQLSTSTRNENRKTEKNFATQKLVPNPKSCKVNSTVKAEIKYLNGSNSNELQDSLKHQIFFAKTWVKRNIIPSRDATLSFYVILMAYHHFCKKNDQLPLNPNDLLQVLYSSLECDVSLNLNDQSLKTNEMTQEYLSTLTELKIEEGSSDDQAKQEDFKDLQSIQFKCDFIKVESDDAYESDLSDSDMKEVSTDHFVPECKSSEERDSSYESFDETSNEAISLHVEHDGKDLTTESTSNKFPTKFSSSLDTPQVTDASETQKVTHQALKVKRQIDDGDVHNKLLPPPKKVKWSEEQKRVIVNMRGLLEFHLQNYRGSVCYGHAKNLAETLVEMLQRKQLKYFLEEFGHSMSCWEKHGSLCFMFKRVVNHVLQANHDCALKNMYGHILRLHLDTCTEDHCGFPNCKIRREERKEKLAKQEEQKKVVNVSDKN